MAMHQGMLDAALLHLTPQDCWDVRTALTHTLVFGTTGSGKTSGTIKSGTKSLLYQWFGVLFCVAKPEDAEAIIGWCRETGRLGSLLDWNGRNGGYNFLAHELARSGNINNVIDVLMAVLEMIRSSSPSPGRASEQFWTDSVQQQLRATIPVIYAATGSVRITDILAFIRSAPSSPEQMQDPAWQHEAAFFRFFHAAAQRLAAGPVPVPGFDDAAAERCMNYWRLDAARLDPKTASNIRISVTTALSRFEGGWLKDAFCGETTLCPELLLSGAIILMNFPVQTDGEDAAIAAKLFKFMTQRVLLARNGMAPHLRERPVAIVADEAQNFLHHDAEFMAQCRSSRVAVLMATQSLPTLYAKIGGDHPHDRAHHLASQFGTVVLHSSACAETNEWMSRKIGKAVHRRASFNESEGTNTSIGMNMGEGTNWGHNRSSSSGYSSSPQGGSYNGSTGYGSSDGGNDNWGRNRGTGSNHGTSRGYSETVDDMVPAGFFAWGLKTGGPAHGNRVSALWFQAGRRFAASGENFLVVEFQQ
uniref:type IV secretory system conjugative DNA transfer family protein n=1 Tax=Sphingomonas sp. AOB5 TaxID=3034017 RepID=UPI0023F6EC7A|nr:TraM recognition domain-containing protein [Sphingomonas sp. AOB5]MDF7776036.1 TraM recognition domain-containing protein [Sphingomonas sp. AOB5]